MQAFLLLAVAWHIGGIIALYQVRLDPPGMRPYLLAGLALGSCLMIVLLVRTQRVRRHVRRTGPRSPKK